MFFNNAGSYKHNDPHGTKNPTFLRRPEVPGFMPSMGSVASSTTLPPSPPPRMAAAAASVESNSLVMPRNTWFDSRNDTTITNKQVKTLKQTCSVAPA